MIIVEIFAGLGNQMFQYALGRALALKNDVPLKLDIGSYTSTVANTRLDIRVYGLHHLNIQAPLASGAETAAFHKYVRPGWIGRFWRVTNRNLGAYYKKPYIVEPPSHYYQFDRRLLDHDFRRRNVYLRGYWQTERYFKDIRDLLVKEFTVKDPPSPKNLQILQCIQQTDAVSLHLRHGNNLDPQNPFGVLTESYYRNAIAELVKIVHRPTVFVFSDDPAWAAAAFKLDLPVVYVGNDENSDYEDLRLMSACKYHIIANSSFSWWGAWLSTWPGKVVYAPPGQSLKKKIPRRDLYPLEWKVLDL
jgi:hypothetical protein